MHSSSDSSREGPASGGVRGDLFVSVDVETDGPVPGPFSMLSIGMTIAGTFDGRSLRSVSPGSKSFYRELRPIGERFEPDAMAVNGLDRDALALHGADPRAVMHEAAKWVRSESGSLRPVFVGYPVVFDWAFVSWYFEMFTPGESPFGHSSCLDIRSLYQAAAGTVFEESGRSAMPEALRSTQAHTHNALDDAVEQGELFINVFRWALERSRGVHRRSTERPLGAAPSWMARRVHNVV